MRNAISQLIKELSSEVFQSHTFEPVVGDVVVNDNPGCKHKGSMGVVQSVQELPNDEGKTATYKCSNSGDSWEKGDTLTKTLDQLVPAVSQDFAYHIINDIPISESPLNRKSRAFLELVQECKTLIFRGAYKPSLNESCYIFCMSSSRYNNDRKPMMESTSMKITRKQLRRVIREAMEQQPPVAEFPDLSDPIISKFADKTLGPSEGDARDWFTSKQSYTYRAGGSSDQSITVYHKPDGQYIARIGGSYSNTLSNDRQAGNHADAISAIEAALASGGNPSAGDLLIPVGEKVKPKNYVRQD